MNKRLIKKFTIITIMILAVAVFASGCKKEAGYTSPESVNAGIVQISNSVLTSGRKVLTDEDARELTKLCASSFIERSITDFLFKVIDITDNKFEVKLINNGIERIDDNTAKGRIIISCVYHSDFIGDCTMNKNLILKIEKEQNVTSFFTDDFWYITDAYGE